MSYNRELILPAVFCATTFLFSLGLAIVAGLSGTAILFDYWYLSALSLIIALLGWCILPFWRAPEYRQLSPRPAAAAILAQRWPLVLLPLMIVPVFNTGYTLAKSAIPFLVGFGWDVHWANLDRMIFGIDPWLISHTAFGDRGTAAISFVYMYGWGAALGLVLPAMLFYARPSSTIRAYNAFMLTWFFGGVVGAAMLSSAGPVFADFADADLGARFLKLRELLNEQLPNDNAIVVSQAYLRETYGTTEVVKGAGISAMPSMHLATAALFVFMAGKSAWRVPAMVFWLIIWVGSVHLGFHYAVDGVLGAFIAWLCWKASARRPARVAGTAVPRVVWA